MISTDKPRYYLLDLLKISTLVAIQTFHAWEFIIYQDAQKLQTQIYFYDFMSYHARCFVIGGQILVAIIFLLFGFQLKSRTSLFKTMIFACFGQIALTLAFMDSSGFVAGLEWDIYIFIALCNALIILLPHNWRSSLWIMLLSVIWLLIPTEYWRELLPQGGFFDVLTGRKTDHNSGAWAPLPWFFHALLFFSLGTYLRHHLMSFRRWHSFETYVWPLLLLASLPFMGAYFDVPIGPHFYWFTFNKSPYIYWANFLPFIFWMRISFLDGLQHKVRHISILIWLSNLKWSRNMGLSYLIAVIYLGLAAEYDEELKHIPYAFDLVFLATMPLAEILARIFLSFGKRLFPRRTVG